MKTVGTIRVKNGIAYVMSDKRGKYILKAPKVGKSGKPVKFYL